MSSIKSLNQLVECNKEFKTSVNLYLSLNKQEKIKAYIPIKSSITILKEYLENVANNKEQATLLVGPYGKGKSHVLLVLLAILTMDRDNPCNKEIISELISKVRKVALILSTATSKAVSGISFSAPALLKASFKAIIKS